VLGVVTTLVHGGLWPEFDHSMRLIMPMHAANLDFIPFHYQRPEGRAMDGSIDDVRHVVESHGRRRHQAKRAASKQTSRSTAMFDPRIFDKFGASKPTYHDNMFCSLILIYLINLDNIVLSFFLPFSWDAIAFSLAKLIKFSKCLLYFVFNKPTIVVCGRVMYILGNFLKGILIVFQ
jgi:hypothetical protein